MSNGRQYELIAGHFTDTWNKDTDDRGDPGIPDFKWHELILTTCGCGSPSIAIKAMAEYLGRVEAFTDLQQTRCDQIREGTSDEVADYLIACMADDLRFTEHGSSIYWCWLDDAGKRWLELYREGR